MTDTAYPFLVAISDRYNTSLHGPFRTRADADAWLNLNRSQFFGRNCHVIMAEPIPVMRSYLVTYTNPWRADEVCEQFTVMALNRDDALAEADKLLAIDGHDPDNYGVAVYHEATE